MEYTDQQRAAFKDADAKRLRKQLLMIVLLFALMAPLPFIEDDATFFGLSGAVLGPISLVAIAVVREFLLEDFARARVENSDLLLPRVQITSDECHESGLLAVGLVTVPQPEPTCSGGPFS